MMRFKPASLLSAAALGFLSIPSAAQENEVDLIDRCALPDDAPVFSRSPQGFPSLSMTAAKTVLSGTGSVPSLMVDGWKPSPAGADVLLAELGKEAGFTVTGVKGLPLASWNKPKASLKEAIETITKNANVNWSFDNGTLMLSRPITTPSSFSAALPMDRDARLAFLDIVRGNGVDAVVSGKTVSVSGSPESIAKARAALESTREVLVFDVLFLRGRPDAGRYDWGALGAFNSMPRDAGGQFSVSLRPSELVSRLKAAGDVTEDSGQTVGAPAGWAVAIPPAQCGRGSGELVVAPRLTEDKLQMKVSGNGLAADFSQLSLGTSALIASPTPRNGWIEMVFIRPRVVGFAK